MRPGVAKITFGTGGMLDLHLGEQRPRFERQGDGGCFPIVAWRRGGTTTWGVEAVMLSAGTNVEWLRDDLGIIGTAAESHDVASRCETADGVVYVPALLGFGTPRWDYGARGTLLGLTRGSERPQIVRAVLEGVAQRGADLVDAAEADTGLTIPSLRVDGGMTDNPTFVQALANAIAAPCRGVTREGGDHVGRRVPGRAGRRHLGQLGRHRRHVAPARRRRAERHARPGAVGEGLRPGGGLDPGALVADASDRRGRSLLRCGPWGRDTGGDGEPAWWPRRGSTTSRKVGAPKDRVLVRARTG